MTHLVDEPTEPRKTGITIDRVWSTPGVHPYDQVTWERRDVIMTNWLDGSVTFEQRGVEFPDFWSLNATNIVTTRYFRGALGTERRETSLAQIIDRVVHKYRDAGIEHGYFATGEDAEIFEHELTWMLLHQVFSFNSPVWFNVGTDAPQQVSACFILALDDSLESILHWYKEEGLIFKGGSGSGINLSSIRGSKELLSSGGTASGPVSFMRGADASAGTIKSGGACLAPWTQVYTTENGPVSVEKLAADGTDFHTISYNPVLGRMQVTRARAFASGEKQLFKVKTDKGEFTLTKDHPVMLSSGGYLPVEQLRAGMSLRPGNITINDLGYHRVGLQDGTKRKEAVHRLVASDILGLDINGFEVHHKDRDPQNNSPENLIVETRANHLRIHAAEDFAAGVHPLQQFHGNGNHPQVSGNNNGMSYASGNRTEEYRERQAAGMHASGVYSLGQKAAARRRMINKAFEILNSGGSIETFSDYFYGRVRLAGRIGYSKSEQLAKIEDRFGSYEEFRDEVYASNHRVVSVTSLEYSTVFDVEVDNVTPQDRSSFDGHNFLIVSETNAQKGYTGIMVHNTRRAAKMVILDVDHPDIEEFIDTKAREEDKIRVLRDAGFEVDLGGRDILTVQYQNANNSVRVNNEFMHAVENDEQFQLINRIDGSVADTVNAKELFHKMAQAAWACADPGIQYDNVIQYWHTNPNTGPITASNPCSEYMSLDNSSCNLASINLMKFRLSNGEFDVERFIKAVEIIITAMDISVSFADFPTEKITKVTRAYRQLGIGYANLGALLMSKGLPYDSYDGRLLAASITSLMSATAYRQSAVIASQLKPYSGYVRNADAHLRVIDNHGVESSTRIRPYPHVEKIVERANSEWDLASNLGRKYGFRNAQISLLAPTGTIGLMMDCDTTGVEPDLALVKFKKLFGGGSMKIVNQTVPLALETMGYTESQIQDISAYILEHGHVVGAPELLAEHYDVFDCAMGDRSIEPMGHVAMMAAVQPFLSGAISKTINMPESATVEDIEEVYMKGWKLGLKALAIYRDNCKVGQPLSAVSSTTAQTETNVATEKVIEYQVLRNRLPKKRTGQTVSFAVAGAEGYMTASAYPDGGLGEIFLKMSKQGSTLAGVMDAFSIAVSVGLQYGVPLETYVKKFTNMRFEPAGITDDPDIRMASSLVDYLFRRLALDYLPQDVREELGILTTRERATNVLQEAISQSATALGIEVSPKQEAGVDAPLCMECGTTMQRAGACHVCGTCGRSDGCS